MRLSKTLDFKSALALVRIQLVPGRVIHCLIDLGFGPTPKFSILSAKRDDYFMVFVISSEERGKETEYIDKRQYILNQQVSIDLKGHSDFLKKDSWINCAVLRLLLISDVEKHLAKNPLDVKCCISHEVRKNILETVAKYGVLSNLNKAAVKDYLGGGAS